MRLSFLILTKDEAASIEALIGSIRRFCQTADYPFEIVLSDDSSDGTGPIAAGLGARVVSGGNRGLGCAYANGLRACAELDGDCIVLLDGDGQADLDDLPRLISAMERSHADMVTGSRFLGGAEVDYHYPRINRFGVWLLSRYLTVMTGQRFSDSHGGLRILTKELARSQEIFGSHTYVQESIVDAVEKGFKVVEVPCNWKKRGHGSSKVVSSIPRYMARTLPFLAYRAASRLFR